METPAQIEQPVLQKNSAWMDRRWLLPLAALALLIVASYWPSIYPSVIWDDADYLTHSDPIRRLDGIWDIWFKPSATAHYFPMLFTAHWLEYRIWGMNIAAFHAMNVVYHIIAATLLWHILKRLKVPGAWLAAAIWAVHPMQVETVAWIAERKNILGSVFFFLGILSYMAIRDAAPAKRAALYVGTILAMVAAILCKQVMVVLPAVLFLVDIWRDQRIVWPRLKLILPLLIPAALIAAVGVYQERHYVGTLGDDFNFTLAQRFAIAGRSLFFYAEKFILPWPLISIYPRFDLQAILYPGIALFVLALIFVGSLWALRTKLGAGPAVLATLYIVLILPALGFVSFFTQLYTFVSDHFAHMAIGAFAIALAVVFSRIRSEFLKRTLTIIFLISAVATSCGQSFLYRSELTLWEHAYRYNPSSWMVTGNLAASMAITIQTHNPQATLEDYAQPVELYKRSLESRPDWRNYYNLGLLYLGIGQIPDAISALEKANSLKPDVVRRMEMQVAAIRHPPYQRLIAAAYERQGKLDEASEWYRKAAAAQPEDTASWLNLGNILAAKEHYQDALKIFAEATKANPQNAELWFNYGILLRQLGRNDEGVQALMRAHEIDPDVINRGVKAPPATMPMTPLR